MIFLLSPAKSLDYETPVGADLPSTKPPYIHEAAELIDILKRQTPAQLATLMSLSDNLATLNAVRYEAWKLRATPKNAKQAILAFNGDVYDGLQAKTLDHEQLAWAQEHIVMLSGLYGVLRPLDLLQPYRLEMGTRLATSRGANLYQFWGDKIATHLNKLQKSNPLPVVINLASQEYFKVVDKKILHARVIECVFEERKNGAYKVISFMAKRARGMMARFAIEQKIIEPEKLKLFKTDGYAFAKSASSDDRWVFRRSIASCR
ncbi:MAG: peroxide stress protein YaaA [Cytophagales bacterium]|nr:peroxide stress protein YaaA [Cytophagales bacterium]